MFETSTRIVDEWIQLSRNLVDSSTLESLIEL